MDLKDQATRDREAIAEIMEHHRRCLNLGAEKLMESAIAYARQSPEKNPIEQIVDDLWNETHSGPITQTKTFVHRSVSFTLSLTSARKNQGDEVRELIEAVRSFAKIDEDYQSDKDDGPFMMVYQKWVEEKQARQNRVNKAIAFFEAATKGDGDGRTNTPTDL